MQHELQIEIINKQYLKTCAPLTGCITEINSTKVDNAKYIDVVMTTCNLTEYNDNYFKKSRCLW